MSSSDPNAALAVDALINTYLRLDEGTAVVVAAHRSHVQVGAQIYSALTLRGAPADVFCFDADDVAAEALTHSAVEELRSRKSVRRTAVVVCESEGPSLQDALARLQGGDPERTPVFRVRVPSTGNSPRIRVPA